MSDRCNQEVYNDGVEVFLTHTIDSKDMERWVQTIAKDSGQKVDWHYGAGRAQVLAIGDLSKVRQAILKNKKMHDEHFILASQKYIIHPSSYDKERIQGIVDGVWFYNGF